MKSPANASTVLILLFMSLFPALVLAHGEDDPVLVKLMLDELEGTGAGNARQYSWDAEAWAGKDLTKLWIKAEGARASGTTERGELQLLYSKAVATYWDFQLGVRHDFEPSPNRTWAAIGYKGLAPYFFEIDAALFIGESGHTALRFQAEYELLLTQRLVLTPDIELNVYGRDDPATGHGSGLAEIDAGLRLRYEIRREFAPYIGITGFREFGDTAAFSRVAGEATSDAKITIGLRAWF